jgi:hypothetical protein
LLDSPRGDWRLQGAERERKQVVVAFAIGHAKFLSLQNPLAASSLGQCGEAWMEKGGGQHTILMVLNFNEGKGRMQREQHPARSNNFYWTRNKGQGNGCVHALCWQVP